MTQHSTYLSPSCTSNGSCIEQWDRVRYRRAQNASENLRRALVRYYHKRAGA